MNNRTHIHQELLNIAPGLVDLPVAMPYTLPPKYFEGLVADVLFYIKDRPEHYPFLSKANPYIVPTGYFDQLPEILMQKVRNGFFADEDNGFIDTLPKAELYMVPEGYFNEFPTRMLQKVKGEDLQQTVPIGYFESLPEQMLAKVRKLDAAKELDHVAPLLNTISRQPVQYVPTGYFEKLQPILGHSEQTAPVVSMKKGNSWLKYAVAASIISLLAFGAYFLFNTQSSPVPSVANQPTTTAINEQLAKLDASTIENYLKSNNSAVQVSFPENGVENLDNAALNEILQSFSDQDLKKNLEETPELPAATNLHI